jgi:hypothetical protein
MNPQQQKLIKQTLIWLVAEVVLNWVGLDTLADYGEFVFEPDPGSALCQLSMTETPGWPMVLTFPIANH